MSVPARAAARLRVVRPTPLALAPAALLLLASPAPPVAAAPPSVRAPAAALPRAPALPRLSALPRVALGRSVLAEAARQRGKPYRWGAAGPHAFDCSGYTAYVFRRVGRRLPHTSRGQYATVAHLPRAAKSPGDLIFNYDARGRIYHVGIYAGAGRIWHAPGRGDSVRQSGMWSARYWVGRVR